MGVWYWTLVCIASSMQMAVAAKLGGMRIVSNFLRRSAQSCEMPALRRRRRLHLSKKTHRRANGRADFSAR
jgi:hypothetical protein